MILLRVGRQKQLAGAKLVPDISGSEAVASTYDCQYVHSVHSNSKVSRSSLRSYANVETSLAPPLCASSAAESTFPGRLSPKTLGRGLHPELSTSMVHATPTRMSPPCACETCWPQAYGDPEVRGVPPVAQALAEDGTWHRGGLLGAQAEGLLRLRSSTMEGALRPPRRSSMTDLRAAARVAPCCSSHQGATLPCQPGLVQAFRLCGRGGCDEHMLAGVVPVLRALHFEVFGLRRPLDERNSRRSLCNALLLLSACLVDIGQLVCGSAAPDAG